jgi:hypothetical protein
MSQTDAAKAIGCHLSQLSRHMKQHLTPAIRAVMLEDEEKAQALNAVDALLGQYAIVQQFLGQAIESGNIKDVALMLGEGRKHIELNAKLTGQLDNTNTTNLNLLVNPEFVWLKDTILTALEPDARMLLSERLQELVDNPDNGNSAEYDDDDS